MHKETQVGCRSHEPFSKNPGCYASEIEDCFSSHLKTIKGNCSLIYPPFQRNIQIGSFGGLQAYLRMTSQAKQRCQYSLKLFPQLQDPGKSYHLARAVFLKLSTADALG